jgi:hypothetical protein
MGAFEYPNEGSPSSPTSIGGGGGGFQARYRFPLKRFILALVLLITGVVLGIAAMATLEIAIGIVAIVCLLPGAYASLAYALTLRGGYAHFRREDWWIAVDEFGEETS